MLFSKMNLKKPWEINKYIIVQHPPGYTLIHSESIGKIVRDTLFICTKEEHAVSHTGSQ